MRQVLTIIAMIPLALLAAGFLGVAHPAGDSLAVFRTVLVAVSALSLLLLLGLRRWRLLLLGTMLALWSTYSVTPTLQATAAAGMPYSLYQKNLWFLLRDHSALLADIRQLNPDFITLQEVSRNNRPLLAALAKSHPARVVCSSPRIAEVAVASRWPLIAGTKLCLADLGLAAMQVTTPDGPVWLVSLHLNWPYPYDQAARVAQVLPHLARLDGPVLLGGDFNMVPWSHTLHLITKATHTRRLGPVHNTFSIFDGRLKLPIDHVLVSRPVGEVWRRPRLGSDHYGLLARFDFR